MQKPRQHSIRSNYYSLLGLSLVVVTSSICSLITMSRELHKDEGQVQRPSDRAGRATIYPLRNNDIEEVEWPPPNSFLRNHSRMVVTIVNYDYVDFADNFAQSLLRQNVSNFWLIPVDDPSYALLHDIYPHHVLPVPPVVTSKRHRHIPNFGSQSFRDLAALRPLILQRLLIATNLTLFYNDIDMVWRQNAWEVVDSYRADRSFSTETPPRIMLWPDGSQQLCSCLLYLDPSTESHVLLDMWQDEMKTGRYKNDQPALNDAVAALTGGGGGGGGGGRGGIRSDQTQRTISSATATSLSWTIIRDYNRFPHGAYYFGREQAPVLPGNVQYERRRRRAVIVHNNWACNKTVKLHRFQQYGLWNLSHAMLEHIEQLTG